MIIVRDSQCQAMAEPLDAALLARIREEVSRPIRGNRRQEEPQIKSADERARAYLNRAIELGFDEDHFALSAIRLMYYWDVLIDECDIEPPLTAFFHAK